MAVLTALLGVIIWVANRTQRPGHWWGDDWALYVRQAQALLDGDPNRVAVENAFTVSKSRGEPFSPPLYPWGFPILLAPAVAIFGVDLDRLAIVEVACACIVALSWYALARRRLGTVAAMVGMVTLALSPLLLSWTELIQSELPFVAIALSALLAIDAAVARGVFSPESSTWTRASWWWLVLIGLGAAAAFTVRREGMAILPAIAAAQLAAVARPPTDQFLSPARPMERSQQPRHTQLLQNQPRHTQALHRWFVPIHNWPRYVTRLAVPYMVAGSLLLALQVAMPSTVVPRYGGTSVLNMWSYRVKIAANLAETVGLKRAWEPQPELFTSSVLGWVAVTLFLCLGVAGVILGLTFWRRSEAHLSVYTLGAFVIGASFRSALNRYVASVGPLLLLLGLCVIAALVARFHRRWLTVLAPTAVLVALLAGDVTAIGTRMQWADSYAAAQAVEWGPSHPDAVAMFSAVESLSEPGDVIAAPKARAMVLETGRAAVQVDDYRPIPDTASVDFVVVERNTKLLTKLLNSPDRYQQVWANTRFVIFQLR